MYVRERANDEPRNSEWYIECRYREFGDERMMMMMMMAGCMCADEGKRSRVFRVVLSFLAVTTILEFFFSFGEVYNFAEIMEKITQRDHWKL